MAAANTSGARVCTRERPAADAGVNREIVRPELLERHGELLIPELAHVLVVRPAVAPTMRRPGRCASLIWRNANREVSMRPYLIGTRLGILVRACRSSSRSGSRVGDVAAIRLESWHAEGHSP